ncbi:MAG: divergent polysaccharide deacetylase family protein [Spirochaetaceae bacterium]|nr:MAG: divergent polysaccharide deacetylase family protein [Spirochaetaceae bacterium]
MVTGRFVSGILLLALVTIVIATGVLIGTAQRPPDSSHGPGIPEAREAPAAPERPDASAAPDTLGDTEGVAVQEDPPEHADAPRLYLVLDDAGQSPLDVRRFTSFQSVFTLAVLPELAYSDDAVQLARALGHEVILHQPMEALNGEDPGPAAIYLDQSDAEILSVLRSNLARYPEARGVNNHMGSRATGDERVMEVVLRALAEGNQYFLDSRTTHRSVAPRVAARLGIPLLARDVFLDHDRSRDSIEAQLDLALDHARTRGYAIVIGHVTVPETADVLLARQEEITSEGFLFLPLSAALDFGDTVVTSRGPGRSENTDDDSGY